MSRAKELGKELMHHAPFTLSGAMLGLLFMLLFRNISESGGRVLFAVFHPAHVVLSAMVTAALYKLHRPKSPFLLILIIGYFGSVGVATLSDCILPYLGEQVLGLEIPSHEALHSHGSAEEHTGHEEHDQGAAEPSSGSEKEDHNHKIELHLGFIEEWYLVNPSAILGIVFAFFVPRTKLPHAGHILISTWASASHILMNQGVTTSAVGIGGLLAILFISVWVPCCLSDIVFPMLFLKPGEKFCSVCNCNH